MVSPAELEVRSPARTTPAQLYRSRHVLNHCDSPPVVFASKSEKRRLQAIGSELDIIPFLPRGATREGGSRLADPRAAELKSRFSAIKP